ncbi:MAG: ATP cone domain-containing protein, partial [Opitutales bacterium]
MSDTPVSTLLAKFNPGLTAAIPAADRRVIKRDGTTVPWDTARITRAVARAFYDVQHEGAENPRRDDPATRFGLDDATFHKVQQITSRAARMLELSYRSGRHPTIEQIQDTVEKSIAAEGEWDVARSYIIFRERQASHRLNHYAENGLSDYIAISKYARYRRELGRRESFAEAARRVLAMHLEHFKDHLALRLPPPDETSPALPGDRRLLTEWLAGGTLSDALYRAFGAVARKRVLPSMRSLQFGGEAILKNHARLFNCSFSSVDRIEFFREYFFLLLAGTGCGFSVQRHHVDRLPGLPVRGEEMELTVIHHSVGDTIEGWADALHMLYRSHLERFKVEFNFSAIRPRGSALRTAGGKAPGHLPLKQSLLDVDAILTGASGRKLRPIEVYDICMFTARAVLSGGIRRSATICLFSPDDEEMMAAKTGNWFEKHPQRSASNNSAVLSRAGTDDTVFRRLFSAQKEFGEPGFYLADHPDYGCNPCCEIGLHPVIEGPLSETETARLRALGYEGALDAGTRLSGWQMCNLSTINGAALQTVDDFLVACIQAAVIGTVQAAYTDIPYLGPVTR